MEISACLLPNPFPLNKNIRSCMYIINIYKNIYGYKEDPRYNDNVCYQRYCCKIKFAVLKKLDRTYLKHQLTDTFEHFFFYKSYVLCIR